MNTEVTTTQAVETTQSTPAKASVTAPYAMQMPSINSGVP